MPIRLLETTPAQLRLLPRDKSVFFFPVGAADASIGVHHLNEAQDLCRSLAEKLEQERPGWIGVLMPPMPFYTSSFRGHVLRDGLIDACRSLGKEGFKHFVCFSGTLSPKPLTAIEEAGRSIYRSRSGRWLRRGGVRTSLVSGSSALITLKDARDGARDSFFFWKTSGDPVSLHSKFTQQQVIEKIFPKLCAVWEGANPEGLFRSWHSILPWNQSFFKAWALALGLLLLLSLWVGFNLRLVLG